jgi:hypothetical protein
LIDNPLVIGVLQFIAVPSDMEAVRLRAADLASFHAFIAA